MTRFNIFCLLGLILCIGGACENTPEFPAPKFDSSTTFKSIVRRDTIDIFNLKCQMEVPNGIDYIEVLDAYNNYELIERLDQYKGKTLLDFRYPIDLTLFERDTLLGYVVRVYDLDKRTYNKAFQLEVKKFSIPEIAFSNGENISVTLPFVSVQAKLATGMVPIYSIILKLDGKEKNIIKPERDTCDYDISNMILRGLNEMRPYKLEIILEDVKGRKCVAIQNIYRVDKIEKPVKIFLSGNMEAEMLLKYNEVEHLEEIDLVGQFRMKFFYNKDKDRIIRIEEVEYGNYTDSINYYFEYNDSKMLVQSKESDYYSLIADDIKYMDNSSNSRIKQFISGAALIENIAYEEGFSHGTYIYAEEWDAPLMNIYSGIRLRMKDFSPIALPTYLEGLPYPLMRMMRWPQLFHDLFLTQYVHSKTVNYLDDSQVKYYYTYTMDKKGRLSEWSRRHTDIDRIDYYRFVYSDELDK